MSSYDALVNKISNAGVREIIEKEFPNNETAARVGVRADVIVTDIFRELSEIKKYQKRHGKLLIAICEKLNIVLEDGEADGEHIQEIGRNPVGDG